jgi:murein DD-endopeptidase MepM/ murein hydrolase activator NlpD
MKKITMTLVAVMTALMLTVSASANYNIHNNVGGNTPFSQSAPGYEGIDWDEFFAVDEIQSAYDTSRITVSESAIPAFAPTVLTNTTQESESNNTISTADVLPSINNSKNDEVAFTGKVSSTSDHDYIKITPPRHGVLRITLTPPFATNLSMSLFSSSGSLLENGAGTSAVTRIFEFVTTKKSTLDYFYIRVYPGSGSGNYSSNDYTIKLQYVNIYSSLNAVYPFSSASGTNIQINSPVGYRTYNGGEYHTGPDISSTWNATIRNITAGTVIHIETGGSTSSTTANYVVVKANAKDPLTNNDIYIRYFHLNSVNSSLSTATGNNTIAAGATIGTVGNTGLNTSGQNNKHLHIDMNSVPTWNGPDIRSNPEKIINPLDLYNYTFTGTMY